MGKGVLVPDEGDGGGHVEGVSGVVLEADEDLDGLATGEGLVGVVGEERGKRDQVVAGGETTGRSLAAVTKREKKEMGRKRV